MGRDFCCPGAAHFSSFYSVKWRKNGRRTVRQAAKGPAAIFSPFYTVKWRKNGP